MDGAAAVRAVSIHASVKDATRLCRVSVSERCFNPRVREGRDVSLAENGVNVYVSIHASVKDATI